jgi:hypothetical protein
MGGDISLREGIERPHLRGLRPRTLQPQARCLFLGLQRAPRIDLSLSGQVRATKGEPVCWRRPLDKSHIRQR